MVNNHKPNVLNGDGFEVGRRRLIFFSEDNFRLRKFDNELGIGYAEIGGIPEIKCSLDHSILKIRVEKCLTHSPATIIE